MLCWAERRIGGCGRGWPERGETDHARFSPLAAALARGDHLGSAGPARGQRAAGLRADNEPVACPSSMAGGVQPRGDRRPLSRPARPGLLPRLQRYSARFRRPGRGPFPLDSWQSQVRAFVLLAALSMCALALALFAPRALSPSCSSRRSPCSRCSCCSPLLSGQLSLRKQWSDAHPDAVTSESCAPSAQPRAIWTGR